MNSSNIPLPNGQRWAITDIHGCLKTFQKLVERIQLTHQDQLFLLGDYINRGPNSKGVIDFIWQLQQDGHDVHCLMGNHEERVVRGYYSHQHKGLFTIKGTTPFLKNFGISHLGAIPENYLNWMENLPTYFLTPGYILVHAGLDFNHKKPLDSLKATRWIRHWSDKVNYKWLGKRIVLHGHVRRTRRQVEQQFVYLDKKQVLNLDAGCGLWQEGYGHLCAFNLDKKELLFQPKL